MKSKLHSDQKLHELSRSGSLDELVNCCQQNLAQLSQSSGNETLDYALALQDLALAYSDREEFPLQIVELEKSLQILSENCNDRIESLRCQYYLGVAYSSGGRYEEAKIILARILEEKETEDDLIVQSLQSYVMKHLARLRMIDRDYSGARELLMNAIRFQFRKFRPGPTHAATLYYLARLYHFQKQSVEAERLVHQSLKILREENETECIDYTKYLRFLGLMCEEQNRFEEAKQNYISAFEIIKRIRPPGHPEIGRSEKRLSQIQERENSQFMFIDEKIICLRVGK